MADRAQLARLKTIETERWRTYDTTVSAAAGQHHVTDSVTMAWRAISDLMAIVVTLSERVDELERSVLTDR